MRRFSIVLSISAALLLGGLALSMPPIAMAQEATPGAEEFMPEGVTFEPLAFASALALPSTGELVMSRASFEPGAVIPIDEGDPSYALAFIESGELTIVQDGPLVVTRAGAFDAAMAASTTVRS